MKENYDNDKTPQEEIGESQKETAGTFESRDGIMAVLRKILGKDKDQSDLKDLSQFAWP